MKRLLFILIAFAVLIAATVSGRLEHAASPDDKPKVDDIVAKHLQAIGKDEARAAVRSRVIAGATQATFKSRGVATVQGGAVLASEGPMNIVTMKFDTSQYPYEKIGYNGSKVSAYQVHPGVYSSLGSFVRANPVLLKEGLMGGALSSAWPLNDLASRKPKLEYAGTKKIDSRQTIELRYLPHGGSDLKISLFFDAETYQHVRTVYSRVISPQMGRTVDDSARMTETRYELVEDFSDFKAETGLTLPHTYKITFNQQGTATQISEWLMTLVQFNFNQSVDAKDFDVSGE
ncbi:MAG TPA: hypothetical protein VNG71_04380 [Pyrinomonadaceae bacterium]|nr:hypothetical protein [Pyrinomonadaceae bacterium]